MGDWLAVHISPATAGWVVALLLFSILYGLILWRVWHGRSGTSRASHEPASPAVQPRSAASEAVEVRYQAFGKKEEIVLSLPPTTSGEREKLIDSIEALLTNSNAIYDRAQASSLGYDVRVREIPSVESMGSAIRKTLEEIENAQISLGQHVGSDCRHLLEPLSRGLRQALEELREKLQAMWRTVTLLHAEGSTLSTVKHVAGPIRDEAHYAFQFWYDHMQALAKLVDRLRTMIASR
jgi:hypothetical protein